MTSLLSAAAQVQMKDLVANEIVEFWMPEHPWLTGVSWTKKRGAIQSFQVQVEAPFEEGKAMLDGTLFTNGNLIRARMGYPDSNEYTEWALGRINKGGIALKLSVDGLSGSLNATLDSASMWNFPGGPLPKDTVQNHITTIVTKHMGFPAPTFSDAAAELLAEENFITLGARTAWDILIELTQKYGCEIDVSMDAIVITGTAEAMSRNPDYHMIMRGKYDMTQNQYPLLEFGPKSFAGVFAKPPQIENSEGKDTRFAYVEQETGELRSGLVKAAMLGSPLGAKYLTSPPSTDVFDADTGAVIDVEPGPSDANNIARAEDPGSLARKEMIEKARMVNAHVGLHASMTSIGIPGMDADMTVKVSNVGLRLGGVYRILELSQSYSAGQFTTTITDSVREGEAEQVLDKVESSAGVASDVVEGEG